MNSLVDEAFREMFRIFGGILKVLFSIAWGFFEGHQRAQQSQFRIPNLRLSRDESVPYDSKILQHLILGAPRVGKTKAAAKQFVDDAVAHPEDSFWSLDPLGSLTDDIIGYAASLKKEVWEWLKSRIVYVRLGDPEWVVPTPEFHESYGTTYEEQVNRVHKNFKNMLGFTKNPEGKILVPAALDILFNAMRLATEMAAITPYHEPFQMTEVGTLLTYKNLMVKALEKAKSAINPLVYASLETHFARKDKDASEWRTVSLSEVFTAIATPTARADLGYYYPLLNPKTAIEKGMIVLIDGGGLINQHALMTYKMIQIFSLILEQINRRRPHDPANNRVNLYIDEVIALLKYYDDEEIKDVISRYRSRNLALTVLAQTLSQFSEDLERDIFLMQNYTIFRQPVKRDAEVIAHQAFVHNPDQLKPTVDQDIYSTEREQGRQIADMLSELPDRTCFVKRHDSEKDAVPHIYRVEKTREVPPLPPRAELEAIKDELLKMHAVRVREALVYPDERMRWLSPPPVRPTAG